MRSNQSEAIKPIYLLASDIPLLRQEARDNLRSTAYQQGFKDREKYAVESGFNWTDFFTALNHYNLFSEKTFIELEYPSGKFDNKTSSNLLSYLESPAPDKTLLILTDKLTASQQKTRWYQAIQKNGSVIPLPPVYKNNLPHWIRERARKAQLSLSNESIYLLSELTQGNLLATQQAIEKLALLHNTTQTITPNDVLNAVNDNAQFTVFDLSNALLEGNAVHALRILKTLTEQQTEPTLILWAICREIRQLATLMQQSRHTPLENLLQKQWASRRGLLKNALNQLTQDQLNQLLLLSNKADKIMKGACIGKIEETLENIVLYFCKKFLQ